MSHYPITLIPPQIEQVKSAQPPVPEPPTLPQQPGPEQKKLNTTLIGVETAIAAISVPIVSQITSIPGWLLFVVAVGAIATHAWYQITTYPQRKQKYNNEATDYDKKLKDYEERKRQHEQEVIAVRSPERIAAFQYNKLLEVLSQTVPHDGNGSTATKNPEEIKFRNYLNTYFPSNIHTGLTLRIPDFQHPYTPDFAYIDRVLNLYIDVELDEPYVYHTGLPTHFLRASKDTRRNNFFINKGWVVIRFSEEQVVCHPHSCCKTIAQQIAEITGDDLVLSQFTNVQNLKQQQQWTHAEAMQMAEERKRDNYQCQVEIKQQIFEPLSLNTSTTRCAQQRGATKAAHHATHIPVSPSPKTTTPHTESSLADCPYCGVKVKPIKLELHKASRCPKRPLD